MGQDGLGQKTKLGYSQDRNRRCRRMDRICQRSPGWGGTHQQGGFQKDSGAPCSEESQCEMDKSSKPTPVVIAQEGGRDRAEGGQL